MKNTLGRTVIFLFSLWIPMLLFGGDDRDHWSFQPISCPTVPAGDNVIDSLVIQRLEEQDLSPSPQADPYTLLRRLHIDLVGLLPSPGEINGFIKAWDQDSELAYTTKVDELLASPHFGERWAQPWLDLARYADSDGYLGDSVRPWAWVYRDWVIEAINRDHPLDRFSIEQLAGDLLPDATEHQIVATGFHRNNLKNTEAGSDKELNRTKQIVDRVATTGTTWLGLTLACAECHDHKHDPISQKEFYQLYAFFNNTNDTDISYRIDREWKAYEEKRQRWEAKLSDLESNLAKYKAPQPKQLASQGWQTLKPEALKAANVELTPRKDHSVIASGKTPSTVTYFVESEVKKATTITGFKLEVFGHFGQGRTQGKPVGRGKNGEFILSMFFPDLIVNGKPRRLKLSGVSASHSDEEPLSRTIESNNEGWRVASKVYQNQVICFELEKPTELPAGSRLKFSMGHKSGTGNSIRHFRLSTTQLPPPFTIETTEPDPTFARLRLSIEKHLANPPTKPTTKAQALVERGASDRRTTYIHIRGDYAREGESVSATTPEILHPIQNKKNPNRLDLAKWLFDRKNPLTARVLANQIWQELFGVGIVSTSDDFGTYGERPTHPLLLDWLACELRDNGWSRKSLIRKIVMSATYRQASINSRPELSNQLLWRQNAFRLPANSVRDVSLVASGLLSPKIGGPGIRPPLPGFVTAVGRSVKWPESQGEDRYRRGLYIILKRTVLYPMLTTFDAPDTSVSCSRRERTNSPMQALTMLNDPVFYECAQNLGQQISKNDQGNIDRAIRNLYFRCLNRPPTQSEIEVVNSAYQDFLKQYGNPEETLIATARIILNLNEFITRN